MSNLFERKKIDGSAIRNIKELITNQFKLIAYDAAGNTSSRTYNLAVNYTSGSGSSGVSIRHASIVAIELSSS